jgi:uncharacterized protein YraI
LCKEMERRSSCAGDGTYELGIAPALKVWGACQGEEQMKRIYSCGVAALTLCLVSASAAAATFTSPVDLHKGPGESYRVIGQIPAGADVDFVDCGSGWNNNWCHVKYKGKDGYVVANSLAPSSGGNNVIVAPIVTTDAAYMRQGPGQKWSVVAVLIPNSEVNVQQCISGWLSGWCKVDFEGTTGWVHGSLLKRKGSLFD